MDVGAGIHDFKGRAGELKGNFGFIANQPRDVHHDLLGFQQKMETWQRNAVGRFDRIEGKLDRLEGRFDYLETKLDELPRALAEVVRAEFDRAGEMVDQAAHTAFAIGTLANMAKAKES